MLAYDQDTALDTSSIVMLIAIWLGLSFDASERLKSSKTPCPDCGKCNGGTHSVSRELEIHISCVRFGEKKKSSMLLLQSCCIPRMWRAMNGTFPRANESKD